MAIPLNVLMVEDSENDAALIIRELSKGGFVLSCDRVETAEAMENALSRKCWDLIIADYKMPRFSGLEAILLAKEKDPAMPVIITSGTVGEDVAVETIKAGANDYLLKGNLIRLIPAVQRALREAHMTREHKEMQEEIVRSNTELQQFAYSLSHDLQEPLHMVVSYMRLLSQRYKGKFDTDADEFIDFAVAGGTRMQEMINGLLEYSRIHTRGEKFMHIDTEAALLSALENLRFMIQDAHAVITHDPLPLVWGDATQLTRVFQNLISNAIKFKGAQPLVIHVACAEKDTEYVFSVQDNGIGLAVEFQERIFGFFQRLHGNSYAGVGIGLAITKRIIERHAGRIWVESLPDKGSTFFFSIPVQPKETATT
ncbi:MAG TPA: ATP-binding protein [Candidatus Omnitrophota bacterium]|nr:ATP-binding protein [Candidatus Omnitrophota bacterium]HPT07061.1 ATP-binding protein [Candidatus Omnitrophota bacterium]